MALEPLGGSTISAQTDEQINPLGKKKVLLDGPNAATN